MSSVLSSWPLVSGDVSGFVSEVGVVVMCMPYYFAKLGLLPDLLDSGNIY